MKTKCNFYKKYLVIPKKCTNFAAAKCLAFNVTKKKRREYLYFMGEAAIQVSTTMTSAQFEQNFMSLTESKRDVY